MNEQISGALAALAVRHVADLQAFVRLPSVAAQKRGVRECAAWLASFMAEAGIEPRVEEGANFPVLMAEVPGGRGQSGERSLLIYLHYDVQPADEPEWKHDPWGAEIVEGRMYGRGTVDNKGPVMAALEAVRVYLEQGQRPPVTIKFLIEGEEEVGSPSLRPVLEKHHDFLNCRALVNYDDNVWFDGRPRVVCGIKGSCAIRLEAHTRREFHAMMAPLVTNAAWRLAWALNTLCDRNGRITIRNFYDDVVPPTPQEIAALKDLRWTGAETLAAAGQTTFLGGRTGTDALTEWLLRPSLNLGGITGGYVAPARKGVVPNFSAAAELRIGTVPNQTPTRVVELLRAHLAAEGFGDITVELRGSNPWARTPIDGELAQALGRSLQDAFQRGVAFQPSFAGSGPEGIFQELFPAMQQAYSGFGPVEDNLHAPNEYILLEDYLRGIESIARLFDELAK